MKSIISVLAVALLSSTFSFAQQAPTQKRAEPSKEQREKMAKLHEEMAACLRSDKSVTDCHQQLMAQCRETMGDAGCPMMKMHGKKMKDGHGHHSHGGEEGRPQEDK